MRISTIICDLDGTLVDSLPGIEASARQAVQSCLPGREVPAMRALVGPPIAVMFARLWPSLKKEQLDDVIAVFRAHYNETGCLLSSPYPEVPQTLARLAELGITMHVLTNKPLAPTERILAQTDLRSYFESVVSPDSPPGFRKKAQGAQTLQKIYHLEPDTTLVVGDGTDDLEAACACGFAFAVAAYGYGNASAPEGGRNFSRMERFSDLLSLLR